jgi:hypothetical protein
MHPARDGRADAARGAGDEHYLVLEVGHGT